MNLTKGSSAKKEHLQNGSSTMCKIKTSGINRNSFEDFKWIVNNYPHHCCAKCLNAYNDKLNNKNN